MAGPLSRPPMKTVPAMVPRDAFIAVCMMSNRKHGTLYIGVAGNLTRRVWQHREGEIDGFTKKYGLKRLVWCEHYESMLAAIQREKSLKKYKRDWKINRIEGHNPLERPVHGTRFLTRFSWVAGTTARP